MPSGWVLLDLLPRIIKLRCMKINALGTLPLRNGKDPDPYQIEKQDLDPYQSEKQDPDPDQKGLDPKHRFRVSTNWIGTSTQNEDLDQGGKCIQSYETARVILEDNGKSFRELLD
jgi:hypothetical protein